LRSELNRRLSLSAGHQEERQANAEWKRAVAAREEAQQQLVELYKARAEGVRRGEPQRHWLH
jgi:hypothetical protein